VGGITIAVHPIVARYTIKPKHNFDDPRGWGRWTTVCLHGKIKQIIIGTYGPTGSGTDTDKESMWAIQTDQMKTVPTEQRKSNPTFQYIHDIQLCIQQAKKLNYEVILIGDTNINLRNDKRPTGKWLSVMKDSQMHITMKTWWPREPHIHTFPKNETWIDQIWVSEAAFQRGAITAAGIEMSRTEYNSDHYMVGIRVNFTALLGKMTKLTDRYTERKRTVRCAVPKSKALYKETAMKRWEGKGGRTLKKNGLKRQRN